MAENGRIVTGPETDSRRAAGRAIHIEDGAVAIDPRRSRGRGSDVARMERRVVLESARRYNIPVAVIINNNSGFGQNLTGVHGVHRIAGDRADRGEALIRFWPTDFSAVARSFGVWGIRVEEPGEIAAALKQAIAAAGPVVVDVVTALEPRAPEPWSPTR